MLLVKNDDGQTWKIFIGIWLGSNMKSTSGKILYSNGDIYIGNIVNFEREEEGVLQDGKDRLVYSGLFLNDLYHGKGESHDYSEGQTYIGQFENGIRKDDNAEVKYDDMRTYVGGWLGDKPCGKGEFNWPDGSYYKGEYNYKGQRHTSKKQEIALKDDDYPESEIGIYKQKDGTTYAGEWQNDLMSGYGTKINKNGIKRNGEWKNNNRIKWTGNVQMSKNIKEKNLNQTPK